jgi:DNA-binding protein H-NS
MSDDINSLDAQIQALLDKKKSIIDGQKNNKLAEVKAIIEQFGFSATDLGLVKRGRKAGSATPKAALEPKYANPSNPTETWHGGRGKRPNWVNAFLKDGGKLEAIEIKK